MPNSATHDLLKMEALDAFTWPVTFRWEMLAPWGGTQQAITLDIPALVDNKDGTRNLTPWIWATVIAPAISNSVRLMGCAAMMWRVGQLMGPDVMPIMGGQQLGNPADREHAGQWVLDTGHNDRWSRRRVFLPGIPRSWVTNDMLNQAGFEGLISAGRAAFMGLQPLGPSAVCSWLIPYTDVIPLGNTSFFEVAFRRVRQIRVCHHPDRAPDPTAGLGI